MFRLAKLVGFALFCSLLLLITAAQPRRAADSLEQNFRAPSDPQKPWVYWWWIKGNVTEQSITRDLEQMKAKGIGGFLLFDARGYGEDHLPPPPARMEFLSPEWRRLVKFAMSEAHRLGLEMSMNLSTHGGSLRAPWNTGANAPKKMIWTAASVQGPKRFQASMRKPDAPHFWDVAVLAVKGKIEGSSAEFADTWRDIIFDRKTPGPLAETVVDLSGKVDAQGHLSWDAPPGDWTVLRFGAVTMTGHETDVDILNTAAVEDHFNRMGKTFLSDAGPLAAKTLTYFYNVSWEGASPTWTPGFDSDFRKFRGYDYHAYLPVLAGMTVRSEDVSNRFLEDFSRTIGDCFLNNCYRRLGDLCHQAGIKWHSESGGPWDRERPLFRFSDQLAFWGANDMPQGEFWHQRWQTLPDGSKVWLSNMRRTAMSAHIYGRPLAAAESFTNMNPHFQEYPAVLKPEIDAAFIDGTNQVVWHTFSASPIEFGKPGIVYFAGTHINPNVTWWQDAGAFLTYLGRGQVMLRHGRFVADACVYTSDRNYLSWGRDKSWSTKASLTLPPGYTYDLINTEVLLSRMSVRNGNLVLPDGMQYRTLVLDLEEPVMPPEALAKIVELAKGGAAIVLGERRPAREPGLRAAADRDAELQRTASELWGNSAGARRFGQGQVMRGITLQAALAKLAIQPDFSGPFEYLHRQAPDADIYFLSGTGKGDCSFRVIGKEPELWDPVTGKIRDAVAWGASKDGRTVVPIELPENGSVFVVFRRAATANHLPSGKPVDALSRTASGARVAAWQNSMPLDGPWDVRFTPGLGAPASARFDQLTPWNDNANSGIRYFSGTATYHKTFTVDAAQTKQLARLQLGEVKDIARVRVNGKSLGTVWTAPWTVDLTGMLHAGSNELEIDLTNTWVNRLVGDAALPEGSRVTKTIVRRPPDATGRYAHLRGYLATDPLLRSGLLGPVRLDFGKVEEVHF